MIVDIYQNTNITFIKKVIFQTFSRYIETEAYNASFVTAFKDRDKDFVEFLIQHDLNKITTETYSEIFFEASKSSDKEFAKLLIHHDPLNLKITNTSATQTIQWLLSFNYLDAQYIDLLKEIYQHGYICQSIDTKIINAKAIHQLARDGMVDLIRYIFQNTEIDNNDFINPERNFFKSTLGSCLAQKTDLEIVANHFGNALPLSVTANFCDTIILLSNSKKLRIKAYEATEVLEYLIKNKYLQNEYMQEGKYNKLDIHLNPGHAFFALDSHNNSFAKGFYPKQISHPYIKPDDYSAEIGLYSTISSITFIIVGTLTMLASYGLGYQNTYPLATAATTMASIAVPYFVYSNFNNEIMFTMDHQIGDIKNEFTTEALTLSSLKNHLKISIFLTNKQVENALEYIQLVENDCKNTNFEHCTYQVLTRNCAIFTKDLYQHTTNYSNNPLHFFTREQLKQYYISDFQSFYNEKAILYTDAITTFDALFFPNEVMHDEF